MQGKPLDFLVLHSIFLVAGYRTVLVRQMNPDLILSTGQQFYFQKAVLLRFF